MIDRSALLKDLQGELPKIEKDILAYSESREDLTTHLQEEYDKAREAGRTAEHFVAWRESQITQAAVAWVLSCVFVRFLEDNNLLSEPVLAGPVESEQGEKRLDHAKQRMVAYFNENPTHEEREYLFSLFEELEKFPVIAELLDHRHNPLWKIPVSADGAKLLIDFFQKIDADSGELVHDFTDGEWDTRFLGDLYQDLSESVRKRYALLQTPEFVESFILDYTLEKAKDTFGLPGLRLIDPTCGSGHFLLTTFERVFDDWVRREPSTNARELAQRALDVVHGVDINPYAIAICRFRLLIAAMKVSGTTKVNEAPDFRFNLACGDSLIHGQRFEWQGQGNQGDLIDEDPIKHFLEVEDKQKLLKILGKQYHAVVGNPPYITVKDSSLNKAYRDRYLSCHMKYSLGVPFTERFFDLAVAQSDGKRAGYVGMITANSFMKREFGKVLINDYLPKKDLTHVIDTSGAYIPGHGTPTVILFARNQKPLSENVRAALGIRAEPATPECPENGLVWSSIIKNIEKVGGASDFVDVVDAERLVFSTHPWSLKGGGAAEVQGRIEMLSNQTLADVVDKIGFLAITGEDEAFVASKDFFSRHDAPHKKFVVGDIVRDWVVEEKSHVLYPYVIDQGDVVDAGFRSSDPIYRMLWTNRVALKKRKMFGKNPEQHGISWYSYMQHIISMYRSEFWITYAEVATHNHFTLCSGGHVYKQTAPVIKLPVESGEDDYVRLVTYLNCSLCCFWMKQVSHQKQLTGGDGVRVEFVSKVPYQFSGTALKNLPIPVGFLDGAFGERLIILGREIHSLARELEDLIPSGAICNSLEKDLSIDAVWESVLENRSKVRGKMILLQEEIDWTCYVACEFCDESLLSNYSLWGDIDLRAGERPFEIMAQSNQDDFEVPEGIPSSWPEEMRGVWSRRISAISSIKEIRVIEDPHYKRRWIGRQGLFNKAAKADELKVACKQWMLNYIENDLLRTDEYLTTCSILADKVRTNEFFIRVASCYMGNEMFDVQQLIVDLVGESSVPQFSAGRYKAKAISKYRAWQEIWAKQRQEDLIDAEFGVDQPLSKADAEDPNKLSKYENAKEQALAKKEELVGDIPVPPKYVASDFRKPSYWSLRGKLDVPKERFFSLPGCEKDGDAM